MDVGATLAQINYCTTVLLLHTVPRYVYADCPELKSKNSQFTRTIYNTVKCKQLIEIIVFCYD